MTAIPPKRHKPLNTLIQVVGFLIGIGALGWCLKITLQKENLERLSQLRDHHDKIAIIGVLTLISFILNGLCFWTTIRSQKKIGPVGVVATNCLAMLLALVPFKLSLLFRVLIHNRRDHVPLLTIGAWFTSVGVGMALVLGSLILATILRSQLDWIWFATFFLCIGCGTFVAMTLARWSAGPAGLLKAQQLFSKLPGAFPAKFAASKQFAQLHSGCAMIGSPWFIGNVVVRTIDVFIQAWRFTVIAAVMAVAVLPTHAVLLPSMYFLIGVVAPSGTAGSREGGATGLARLLSIDNWEEIATVFVTISLCELVLELITAPFAAFILKPWKLKRHAEEADQTAAADETARNAA